MSVVLDSSGDSTRGSGIVIPLMCGSLSARPLRVTAFFTMLFLLTANGGVWAANDRAPLAYFLSERPIDLSLSTLPANAQNVVVARVRLSDSLLYLVGRAIDSMSPPPGDLYLARLEILSVLQGEAPSESRPLVTFWPRDNARLNIPPAVPWTPKQLATEYFVVVYSDSKGVHLAGFPISDAAYHAWEQEGSEFHRERRNDLLPKR